mgnify:CR=1 FL=1
MRVLIKATSIITFCFFCLSANARSLEDIQDSGQIIVAVYEDYAPYSFQKNVENRGIDVDIAREIAKGLGVSLEIMWLAPDESTEDDLRNAIWKGHMIHRNKADLMMRVPYDRAFQQKRDDLGLLVHELVHMFAPYHTESWQVAHAVSRLPELTTLNYFAYHKVGTEIDTVPHMYLSSVFGARFAKNIVQYRTTEHTFSAMQNGDVDAVMGLRSQIGYFSNMYGSKEYQVAALGFPQLGKQKWDIGMAVHNDFRALSYAAGDVISEMINNGQMAKVFAKYNAKFEIPDYYRE